MSLGLGLGLPFLRKIAGGGAGSLLEQVIQIVGSAEGAIIDPTAAFARNAIWEDSARTTLASVDGPVGSIQDELLRYYAAQATTANKPILRSDGTHYWLESDGTKKLTFSLATPISGDTYMQAAARRALGSNSAARIVSTWVNDVGGGADIYTSDNSAFFFYKTSAGNDQSQISPVDTSADFVTDGRYTTAGPVGAVAFNGVDGTPTGSPKVSTNLAVALMNQITLDRPFAGNLYCALLAGIYPSPAQLNTLRQWAASRTQVNPL